MEFIKFIFSSFWHFTGTLILATVILNGTAEIIAAIFNGIALRKYGYRPTTPTVDATETSMTDRLQKLANDPE